jgi:hypothetical protein
MRKCIIVLDGISEAKTKFTNLAIGSKDRYPPDGIWTWGVNASNVISVALRSMGWDGIKNDKYYECLKNMKSLVNESYDFTNWYHDLMIKKFNGNLKVKLLIIHNAGSEAEELLRKNEEEQEVYFVNLVRDETQVSDKYDKTIVFDENFETKVYELFDVLLIEKENKVNE